MRARRIVGKLFRALLGLVVLLLGYCGLFAARASFLDLPLVAGEMTQQKGAFHVHSTLSDGRATPEHIARIAAGAGLQFVILTDHNTAELTPPRREAGVLLIFGVELSTAAGHLVALGLTRALTAEEREFGAMEAIVDQGALAVIAHPVQWKRPWADWEAAKLATGMELYSADSMFREAQRSPISALLPALGAYFANPTQGLTTLAVRQHEVAGKLVELSSSRAPLIALCAVDAHGVPSYRHVFGAMSMVLPQDAVLPEEPEAAQRELLRLIRGGEAYCAFQGLAPADGFELKGVGEGRAVVRGAKLEVTLPATLPKGARIDVLGAGRLLEDGRTVEATSEGAIQLEVWVDAPGRLFGATPRPWIVASPIRVLPAP